MNYSYHAFISDRAGELMELEAAIAVTRDRAIRDLYGVGRTISPRAASPRSRQVIAHNARSGSARES